MPSWFIEYHQRAKTKWSYYGPSNDGGYWLIGLSEKIITKLLNLPFINIRWSNENVLQIQLIIFALQSWNISF